VKGIGAVRGSLAAGSAAEPQPDVVDRLARPRPQIHHAGALIEPAMAALALKSDKGARLAHANIGRTSLSCVNACLHDEVRLPCASHTGALNDPSRKPGHSVHSSTRKRCLVALIESVRTCPRPVHGNAKAWLPCHVAKSGGGRRCGQRALPAADARFWGDRHPAWDSIRRTSNKPNV